MTNKVDLADVSFLIPVRIDSLERFENLLCVTTYLLSHFETNIIVLEADKENNGLLSGMLPEQVKFLFEKDLNPIFHRTRYLNKMTSQSTTQFVAIWDADVVVNHHQIISAVESLRSDTYDFVYPYDGRYMETGVSFRKQFIGNQNIKPLEDSGDRMAAPYTTIACGGGFIAKRASYIKAGMENENFYGWGPEDSERLKRWHILEMPVGRVKGYMFHLFHPRGENSYFKSEETRQELLRELDRISTMSKTGLEMEINTWMTKWA